MKHSLQFDFDNNSIRIVDGGERYSIDNFFVKPPNELTDLGFLPPVVKSISPLIKINPLESRYIIIVERKPAIESLRLRETKDSEDAESPYMIPVPWQHYFVTVSKTTKGGLQVKNMGLYFSSTSLNTMDHKFYTPYLPNVHGDVTPEVLPEVGNLVFNPKWMKLPDYSFATAFETFFSSWWFSGVFNFGQCGSCLSFIDALGKKTRKTANGSVTYEDVVKALNKMSEIPFDSILSDEVFAGMTPAFTFADYLKALANASEGHSFDFKETFTAAVAERKAIKKPSPIPAYRKLLGSSEVVGWTNSITATPKVYQDDNGQWRRSDGTFASREEIHPTNPYPAIDFKTL